MGSARGSPSSPSSKEILTRLRSVLQPALFSLSRSGQAGEAIGTMALCAGFVGIYLAPLRQWGRAGFLLASIAVLLGASHLGTMQSRGKAGMGRAAAGLVIGLTALLVAVLSEALRE